MSEQNKRYVEYRKGQREWSEVRRILIDRGSFKLPLLLAMHEVGE
jgi:hypothetical protein